MPYIRQGRRDELNAEPGRAAGDAGELNYQISTLCNKYLRAWGLNYQNLNEVIGVLECAKLELYRRMAAPYEDAKCGENGDVYV